MEVRTTKIELRMDALRTSQGNGCRMSISTWLIDIALIGMVLRQVRARRLTVFELALPLGIVLFVGVKYLDDFSTSSGDLTVVLLGCATGLILGVGCGIFTLVYAGEQGKPMMRATAVAAALWIFGMGFRLVFQVYESYGSGEIVARLSAEHHISSTGWTCGLVLMALVQVVSRTAIVALSAFRLRRRQDRAESMI